MAKISDFALIAAIGIGVLYFYNKISGAPAAVKDVSQSVTSGAASVVTSAAAGVVASGQDFGAQFAAALKTQDDWLKQNVFMNDGQDVINGMRNWLAGNPTQNYVGPTTTPGPISSPGVYVAPPVVSAVTLPASGSNLAQWSVDNFGFKLPGQTVVEPSGSAIPKPVDSCNYYGPAGSASCHPATAPLVAAVSSPIGRILTPEQNQAMMSAPVGTKLW